jgi:hypothetical protein
LSDEGVEGERYTASDGNTVSASLSVEDLGWDDPRQGSTGEGEGVLEKPAKYKEEPQERVLGVRSGAGELGDDSASDDESNRTNHIAQDERPAASNDVNEQDCAQLSSDTPAVSDALVEKGLASGHSNEFVDLWGEVLNRGNTSHLHGSLDGGNEYESAETCAVGEQLFHASRAVALLVFDGEFDLIKLRLDPRVVDVAVAVQFRKGLERLILSVVVHEPARRLGEEKDEATKNTGWDYLNAKRKTPLLVVGRPKVLGCAVCAVRCDGIRC